MKYGCIGEHLGHSFSKEVHEALSPNPYEIHEVARKALDDFMVARDFEGINVTIPYKEDVIKHLSYMSEQAKAIGAVNTIVNKGGVLYGYNTDFFGMCELIARTGVDINNKTVAILGTGGTSRTANAVASHLGAKEILTVSRTPRERIISYEQLASRGEEIEVIINTTPVGMFPRAEATPITLSDFPRLEGLIDAIYNPLRPQLVIEAQKRGIPASGGLYMLVAQAVRASEFFLDCKYPDEVTERVFRKVLSQKENIVLCGMPGCGKSTVGKTLAAQMERKFFDLDEEITRVTGKHPSVIIAEEGEKSFREIETRVLREALAQKNSIVLATGGGAILKDENIDLLRRNGRIYFLDRPIDLLAVTDDRPLSSSPALLQQRYEERYDRYCAVSDVHIDGAGSIETVAEAVRKDFFEG